MAGANRRFHHPDMFGRSSAAAAYEAHSSRNKFARVARHVFGRAEIYVPSFHVARHSSIRHCRKRSGCYLAQTFDRIEHSDRADAAIDANHIGSPLGKSWTELLRRRAIETTAVFVDGD